MPLNPWCHANLGILKWSPNARGILARPWISSNTPSIRAKTDIAISRLLPSDDSANQKIVAAVEEVATRRGLPMATISTAWCLSKGVSPIVGLNSKERMDEVIQAVKLVLSKEEITMLEAAYTPKNVVAVV